MLRNKGVAVGLGLTLSLFGVGLASGGDLGVAPPALPPLIYNLGFETGTLAGWYNARPNLPVVQTELVRDGRYAIRSFLDSSDPDPLRRQRTELKASGSGDAAAIGKEFWYGFSVYLPKSFIPDTIEETLAQFHAGPDNEIESDLMRNPPLTFITKEGKWQVVNRWDARATTLDKEGVQSKTYHLGLYDTDKWTDWVVNVKWSYDSEGFLKVWKNGVLVINQAGPNCYNDLRAPHFKMGIYKGYWTYKPPSELVKTRTAYHDGFRMAGSNGSYKDVAPREDNVLAKPNPPSLVQIE